MEGFVLRYGGFYGPGTSIDAGGEHSELVRKRKFPIGGDGAGVWSFVHIDDAAAATVAAIEGGAAGHLQRRRRRPGADLRVAARRWPSRSAAPPPRRLPAWLIRLAGGAAVAVDDDPRSAARRTPRPAATSAGARPTAWRDRVRELAAPSASTEGSPVARSACTRKELQKARLDSSSSSAMSISGV